MLKYKIYLIQCSVSQQSDIFHSFPLYDVVIGLCPLDILDKLTLLDILTIWDILVILGMLDILAKLVSLAIQVILAPWLF